MPKYTFDHICGLLNGEMVKSFDATITNLLIDSRSILSAVDSLFFALVGERHNGHQYISELYEHGVRNFVVQKGYLIPEVAKTANFIKVEDTNRAFQELARKHRESLACKVVGITGSNGKTVVKEWIAQLVGSDYNLTRSPRSYNSQVGVPLSVWLMEPQTDLALIEAGISEVGEMARLQTIIQPQLGIFTNIGEAHQENFNTLEQKLQEKLLLFKGCQTLVYCHDHALVDQAIKKHLSQIHTFSWGWSVHADVVVLKQQVLEGCTFMDCRWKGEVFQLKFPFEDAASAENVMHATSFLLVMGFRPAEIAQRVERLMPVAMRLEQKEGVNGCLVVNDSYNLDINSLGVALDFLSTVGQKKGLSRVLILSDILQSGLEEKELYVRVEKLIRQKGVEFFIGIGASLMRQAHLFNKSSRFFATTEEFLKSTSLGSYSNMAILVKGSRNYSFERISEYLEFRRHRTTMEVNLSALINNLNYFRAQAGAETMVMAMVKAFSYGSGSFEIANLLQHQKVDYLGVAFADEGVELRVAGINLPIIVMNPEEKSFSLMLQYQLEPEIYSIDMLCKFAVAVEREGLASYPVHLKLETGMFRLGIMELELEEVLTKLKNYPRLKVKSVFSHLVGSDEGIHNSFTHGQIALFSKMVAKIKEQVGYPFIRHILNSAGIERFPDACFDMVRLGIGLYGVSAVQHPGLKNVATLKSTVSQIKSVPAHQTVGYSRKGSLNYDAKIAIVPVGYADGFDRRLSNGVGRVMINGVFCAVVGNVCMDMCMVDVTHAEVCEGDTVIIFGDAYPFTEVAKDMGTIPYEVLTGISRRVKRVYYQE